MHPKAHRQAKNTLGPHMFISKLMGIKHLNSFGVFEKLRVL